MPLNLHTVILIICQKLWYFNLELWGSLIVISREYLSIQFIFLAEHQLDISAHVHALNRVTWICLPFGNLYLYYLCSYIINLLFMLEDKLTKKNPEQSLLRLKEPAVILRCRKEDRELVESVLESAKNEYADKANIYPPEIMVDRNVYLPPAPSHYEAHGPSW